MNLFDAVENGNLDRVKELLVQGVNINTVDENGITALILAVFFNYPEIVTELLSQGADIYIADADGDTALMKALKTDNKEMIKLLRGEVK